jgi:hypothetical protein
VTAWRTGPFLGPRADRVIGGVGSQGLNTNAVEREFAHVALVRCDQVD